MLCQRWKDTSKARVRPSPVHQAAILFGTLLPCRLPPRTWAWILTVSGLTGPNWKSRVCSLIEVHSLLLLLPSQSYSFYKPSLLPSITSANHLILLWTWNFSNKHDDTSQTISVFNDPTQRTKYLNLWFKNIKANPSTEHSLIWCDIFQ